MLYLRDGKLQTTSCHYIVAFSISQHSLQTRRTRMPMGGQTTSVSAHNISKMVSNYVWSRIWNYIKKIFVLTRFFLKRNLCIAFFRKKMLKRPTKMGKNGYVHFIFDPIVKILHNWKVCLPICFRVSNKPIIKIRTNSN